MKDKLKSILKRKQSKVYLIGIILIIIDQITKLLVMNYMDIAQEIPIIKNFFSLYYVTNTGAAFSSLSNQVPLLIGVTLFCIALITNIIEKEKFKNKYSYISLGILFGGMIGNLIDRVFYKNVIDFFSFTIFNYKFAVFNIADIGITLGVVSYLIINILEDIREKK